MTTTLLVLLPLPDPEAWDAKVLGALAQAGAARGESLALLPWLHGTNVPDEIAVPQPDDVTVLDPVMTGSVLGALRLGRVIRKLAPRHVLSPVPADAGARLALALALPKNTGVLRPRGTLGRTIGDLHLLLRRAAKVIPESLDEVDVFEDLGAHLGPAIPRGVDTASFAPNPDKAKMTRARLGVPETAPLIGMLAPRFGPEHGHRVFLDAASILGPALSDARFLCFGGVASPQRKVLESAAIQMGIADQVLWREADMDLTALLPALDMLTAPRASAPLGMAEALACGVPVVAVRGPTATSILRGESIIVPDQRADMLAEAWRTILSEPADARVARARKARDHAAATLSHEVCAEALITAILRTS